MATIVTRETGATAVNRALTNAELDNNFINLNTDIGNKQPLDEDLTAIAALTGSGGLLKRVGDSSWLLDYSTYATQTYVGIQIANLVSSAPTTLDTLNELATALGNDANFSTTITTALGNKQPLDADLTAIAALSGTSGFLKKTAADTWALDTSNYLTAESDTFASVTGRGASTTSAITVNNTITSSDTIKATNGRIALRDDSIENWATASDSAGIAVNYYGYASGTSYFRDFSVFDGKGGLRFKTYGSDNYAYAPGSFRAPIFYDSNDTGTYINPNGSSIINSGGSYPLEIKSTQRYITRFWNTSVSGYGFWLANDANTLVFHADSYGDKASLDYSGNFISSGSMRAPIFYDSDDTNYYLNPNSGSNLKYLVVSGDWGSSPYGSGHETFTIRSTHASFVQRQTNGNQGYWLHHIASGGDYFLYGGRGNPDGSSWDWSLRALPNSDGNYVEFRTSARAPIFYDKDDTGYYIDPAGTSVSASLNGPIIMSSTPWTGEVPGKIQYHSSNWYFQYSSWFHFRNASSGNMFYGDSVGNTWSYASSRAPIFYDSDDTTYYLDPNSTGTSLKVAGNIDLYARSASWAEGIRIRVPSTGNWGGIRWTRDRGDNDGNWALGYTALDSTDDFILWANNSGDGGSIKFRITKAGTMTLNGAFNATSKSFLIDHPTKPGMKLRYGSLEGPENGVYIRGKQRGNRIELPDYWTKLIDPDSITVTLTPVGKHQKLYVDKIENNAVYVGNDGLFSGESHYFYVVYAERIDVEKLGVEIPA